MSLIRWDIYCPRCHEHVGSTFSTEPLPGIYHPQCAEDEQEEDEAREQNS